MALNIKAFQQREHIPVTGAKDPRTRAKLMQVRAARARAQGTPKATQPPPPDPIQAAVRLKYGPQEQDVQQQIRASGARQANVGNWWQDYVNATNAANAASQQQYANAATQTQQRADSEQAPTLTGVDPSVTAQANQAAASRRASLGAIAGSIQAGGANQDAFLGARAATGVGQKAQAQTAEQNRTASLRNQLGTLKQTEGDYAQQLKSQAAKDALNAQIAQQGLGIKLGSLQVAQTNSKTAQTLAGNTLASGKSTRHHQSAADALAGKKFNSAQEKDAYLRAHHLGPYKPAKAPTPPKVKTLSPGQTNTFIGQVGQAQAIIGQLNAAGIHDSHTIRGYLLLGGSAKNKVTGSTIKVPKIPHDAVNFAYDLYTFGTLSGPNRARIKGLRLNAGQVPRNWTHGQKRGPLPLPGIPLG